MRLLHTKTLQLHEFFEKDVPPYAILSHRWDEAEVTYDDLVQGRGPSLKGWSKVTGCCAKAAEDGWEYAWIDSCCIDKSSSAELSEAINSMFKWYQCSEVCYVFLSDVRSGQDPKREGSDFRKSKWFTRGWTLQELLAPMFLEFHDQNWQMLGTKFSLEKLVSDITGISIPHLGDYRGASVAQKMYWASHRQTKRIEDEAYSLFGLFGINLPPLYGEGYNAFLRLQLEIMNQTDDESLFAWVEPMSRYARYDPVFVPTASPFAERVAWFEDSRDIVPITFEEDRISPTWTSRGLLLQMPSLRYKNGDRKIQFNGEEPSYLVPLNCHRKSGHSTSYVSFVLVRDPAKRDCYRRSDTLIEVSLRKFVPGPPYEVLKMYLQIRQPPLPKDLNRSESLEIRFQSVLAAGFSVNKLINHGGRVPFDEPSKSKVGQDSTASLKFAERPDSLNIHFLSIGVAQGLIGFVKEGDKSWYLSFTAHEGVIAIDLAILEMGQEIRETSLHGWVSKNSYVYAEGPIPDRMSLELDRSVFVSATLRRLRTGLPRKPSLIVELSFDNYQQWPSPAEAWARRKRPFVHTRRRYSSESENKSQNNPPP